jgi:hypothetical protein
MIMVHLLLLFYLGLGMLTEGEDLSQIMLSFFFKYVDSLFSLSIFSPLALSLAILNS